MQDFLIDVLKIGGPVALVLVVMYFLLRPFVDKNIFPQLETRQAYRLLAFFLFVIWSTALFVIWTYQAQLNPIRGDIAATRLPKKFVHASGSFEKVGDVWYEYPGYGGGNFVFSEGGREGGYLHLVDHSRLKNGNDRLRPFTIRMPIIGGMAQWSYPNPWIWQDLYVVRPEG